jgi:hypothetical protein
MQCGLLEAERRTEEGLTMAIRRSSDFVSRRAILKAGGTLAAATAGPRRGRRVPSAVERFALATVAIRPTSTFIRL